MNITLDIPTQRTRKNTNSDFSPTDTHMVHFIKGLIQERLFSKWAKDNNLDENVYRRLFVYAVGHKLNGHVLCTHCVPLDIAFASRTTIQSAMWFVPYSQKLPDTIVFHSTHEYNDFLTKATVGRLLLSERIGKDMNNSMGRATLADIARECKIDYGKLYNLIWYVEGIPHTRSMWRGQPNKRLVLALSKYVPIDTWFIFPDELDDDKIKELFLKWPPHDIVPKK